MNHSAFCKCGHFPTQGEWVLTDTMHFQIAYKNLKRVAQKSTDKNTQN